MEQDRCARLLAKAGIKPDWPASPEMGGGLGFRRLAGRRAPVDDA